MSDLIARLRDSLTESTSTSETKTGDEASGEVVERVPFTEITGKGEYELSNPRVSISTGEPTHKSFTYLYATDSEEKIVLNRLVLPVIETTFNSTTTVVDGAVTTGMDVSLYDVNGDGVDVILSEPDESVINDSTYVPSAPVHSNCKLISKIMSEGVQSFDLRIPLPIDHKDKVVIVTGIPTHIETRVLRSPGYDDGIINPTKKISASGSGGDSGALPIHALDKSTQRSVFTFVVTHFDLYTIETKRLLLECLGNISDGILEEHAEELCNLLYTSYEGEYAREFAGVIPITENSIPSLLSHITNSEAVVGDNVKTRGIEAAVISVVSAVTKYISQGGDKGVVDGELRNEFISRVVYPVVSRELTKYANKRRESPEEEEFMSGEWQRDTGFETRVEVVLEWLRDEPEGVTLESDVLYGLVCESVSSGGVNELFVVELLNGRFDGVISVDIKENSIRELSGEVEELLGVLLRGSDVELDVDVSESVVRSAAEKFEEITGEEVIRRDPPVGYGRNESEITEKIEEREQENRSDKNTSTEEEVIDKEKNVSKSDGESIEVSEDSSEEGESEVTGEDSSEEGESEVTGEDSSEEGESEVTGEDSSEEGESEVTGEDSSEEGESEVTGEDSSEEGDEDDSITLEYFDR